MNPTKLVVLISFLTNVILPQHNFTQRAETCRNLTL